MKIRQIIILLFVSLILSFGSIFAQNGNKQNNKDKSVIKPQPGFGMGMMRGEGRGLAALKLTDDQKTKIEDLKLNLQKEIIKLNSEIQLNKVELEKIYKEKEFNTTKLLSLSEAIDKTQSQIKKLRLENWIKVYNLLDKDQQVIWKKLGPALKVMAERGDMMKRGNMRQGMMGRGVQGRPGPRNGMGMMQNRMPRPSMQGRRMNFPPRQFNVQKDTTSQKQN